MTSEKLTWPAAERNKGPILEQLRRVLPETGDLLELASGTGQHAVHCAGQLPTWRWQPTDVDATNLASIAAHVRDVGLQNLLLPLPLDVTAEPWPVGHVDAVFNANMIHIAPWNTCLGMLRGVGRVLRAGGVLVLYGPYQLDGQHTARSNAEFHASLQQRDPTWGVRDLGTVREVAAAHGLDFVECVAMPANNQLVVFRRAD